MTTFTVGEIASRIREPQEAVSAVTERLRNWTKEGLLKPIGGQNPGTGRHRRYPERALLDAAILSKLSRHFGIWAPRVPLFNGALSLAADAAKRIRDRAVGDNAVYLTVSMEPAVTGDGSAPLGPVCEIQYDKVDNVRRSLRFFRSAETAIVINITRLLERIDVPIVGQSS